MTWKFDIEHLKKTVKDSFVGIGICCGGLQFIKRPISKVTKRYI